MKTLFLIITCDSMILSTVKVNDCVKASHLDVGYCLFINLCQLNSVNQP